MRKNDSCTAFLADKRVASGSFPQVIVAVKDTLADRELDRLLVFDDATGKPVDIDFRGRVEDNMARLEEPLQGLHESALHARPGRRAGRPKLGVVSGEVTLLPRHWEWLKSQPGGASVTLRKLIDEARRTGGTAGKVRASQEAAYHFMTAVAGDYPHYEQALRELYAGDSERFYRSMAGWPPDIQNYIKTLAADAFADGQRKEPL